MKIGMYAGTFDPPTLAHLNLIERASKLCDTLLVCIGENILKKDCLIPLSARLKILAELLEPLKNVKVVSTHLLMVEFAQNNQVGVLIRGLRSADNFESEFAVSSANRELSGIETLFLISKPELRHISSSLVREIYHFGGNIDHFVPNRVKDFLSGSIRI